MNIKPIKTNKDYKEALARVEKIWDAKLGTKLSDEPDVLTVLIEKYENDKFNIYRWILSKQLSFEWSKCRWRKRI